LEAVAVKGLTYKYWPGGPLVLNGIDFNVFPGDLALDPQVLVVDEVMSPLDSDGKKRVASILDKLRAAGKSIIIVEHDLEAVAFADRLMVLNNGKSARFDRTEKVLADRDFLAEAGLLYDDEGLNTG